MLCLIQRLPQGIFAALSGKWSQLEVIVFEVVLICMYVCSVELVAK